MQSPMPRKVSAPLARKKTSTAPRQKRARGRPGTSKGVVGRDAIVAAACRLLEKLPPHQVPTVLIARKAGVDPALVRYYFPNRDELLFAVVEHTITTWVAQHPEPDAPAAEKLSAHIADMFEFSCRARSMQRLMVDGCAESKSPSVRARVRDLNSGAVRYYARLLHLEGDDAASSPDPLFMHIAVIGLCEFFAAAQAMILPLAPKHLDAPQLAQRYEAFIRKLVLDGLRSRVELAGRAKVKADA
jgi:TetR/AcrR family transcriptional regulator